MSPKQRDAVEHAYLAIKVLEHGLPMGVQAARDTLAKLQDAFPSIEDRTARKIAADAVATGTGYACTAEDGTLQHVPAEEVRNDLSRPCVPEPCEYCGDGKSTGLPGNACENCMNTGLKYPERAAPSPREAGETCHCSAACQDLGIDKCRYHRPAVGSTIETAGCYCDQVANPQECKDAGRCIMKASVINERRSARDAAWFALEKHGFSDNGWIKETRFKTFQIIDITLRAAIPVPNERRTARELISQECDWPAEGKFTFHDDPGEHDPCYIVMPGGAALPVNHHARPGVDIARAKFIIDACNAALTISDDEDETFYEIGKRDGYEDAIQDLDLATGGDGEFKGSTIPGGTVDVPAMKARIIERLAALPPEPEGERRTARDHADYKLGGWMAAALDDPSVCAEMKADINTWFEAHQPGLIMPALPPGLLGREALRERLLSEGAISLHEGSSPSYSNCEDDDEGAVIPIPVRLRDDLIAALPAEPGRDDIAQLIADAIDEYSVTVGRRPVAISHDRDMIANKHANSILALLPAPSATVREALDWAVSRWNAEVKNRPLQNIHRRSIDTTWRQVIRHFGGDDVELCGPSHDALLAECPVQITEPK